MDTYDFLNLETDLSGVVVTVFDISSCKVVYDSTKSESGVFDLFDLGQVGYYEVASYDIFVGRDGRPCIEVNIEIDEDKEFTENGII